MLLGDDHSRPEPQHLAGVASITAVTEHVATCQMYDENISRFLIVNAGTDLVDARIKEVIMQHEENPSLNKQRIVTTTC